jgi:hypothetical protein
MIDKSRNPSESLLSGKLTQSTKIVASPNQVATEVEDQTMILDMDSGLYFGLNAVGSTVWNRIQSPSTVQQIYDAVLTEYQVDRQIVERDVNSLLEKMWQHELIDIISS